MPPALRLLIGVPVAIALAACGSEKDPGASTGPSGRSAPAEAPTPAPATPAPPAPTASVPPNAPAAPDPLAAARTEFEVRAERKRLHEHAFNDPAIFGLREHLRSEKPGDFKDELLKRLQQHEKNLADFESSILKERAEWEAKKWAGYPPSNAREILVPPQRERNPFTAIPGKTPEANAANTAMLDCLQRIERSANQLATRQRQITSQMRQLVAKMPSGPEGREHAQTVQKMNDQVRQISNEMDAAHNETVELLIVWHCRMWNGYTAPADPDAPPPRPWKAADGRQ